MAPARMRPWARLGPHNFLIDERVGNETGEPPHIDDITSQGQEPPVGKKQGLDGEDRGHDQEGGIGPQQDGQDHAAGQMAAGAGGRNGEVDHLGRENKGSQNSHQRHLVFIQVDLEFSWRYRQ